MKTFPNALVLSGGSIKGAFQAGALSEVLKTFSPDAIYGVTTGALNGLFLANEAGRAVVEGKKPDWPEIGERLVNFWLHNITSPASIMRKRNLLMVGWKILIKEFDGFTSMSPMRRLIERTVHSAYLAATPVHFSVGCLDVTSGELVHAAISHDDFMKYVYAAMAEPIVMPHSIINGKPFVDAAVRIAIPMDEAIRLGAKKIVAIDCHATKIGRSVVDMGDLLPAAKRLSSIITWNQNLSDLKMAQLINELVLLGEGSNPKSLAYRKSILEILRVQPESYPQVDIAKFSSEDILRLIMLGKEAAQMNMASQSVPVPTRLFQQHD